MLYVKETDIINLLESFKGYTYASASKAQDPRYPFALPGVSMKLAPPKQIDCCTFVEALLVKAWANAHGSAFVWNLDRHKKMMIVGSDLYSPVTAVIEANMAKSVSSKTSPPPPWTLVQDGAPSSRSRATPSWSSRSIRPRPGSSPSSPTAVTT